MPISPIAPVAIAASPANRAIGHLYSGIFQTYSVIGSERRSANIAATTASRAAFPRAIAIARGIDVPSYVPPPVVTAQRFPSTTAITQLIRISPDQVYRTDILSLAQ